MQIDYSKSFIKRLQRLSVKIQLAFEERLSLFIVDPFHPFLRNHVLHGEFAQKRSISVTGDYRAIYEEKSDDWVVFIEIGTHAQLYP